MKNESPVSYMTSPTVSTIVRPISMLLLFSFVAAVCAACLESSCTSAADCNTCASAVPHTVFATYNITFGCTGGNCVPLYPSNATQAAIVKSACNDVGSLCCFDEVNNATDLAVCQQKTCLVTTGCLPIGRCAIPDTTDYRDDLSFCCNDDGGCPASNSSCSVYHCGSRNCVASDTYAGCCEGPADCPTASGARCLVGACVPRVAPLTGKVCATGIDKNCVCTSNLDCDDGITCTTNTCNTLTNRCTATYFSGAGGSSCCSSAALAPGQCASDDQCLEVLGCGASEVVANASLTFLPKFNCLTANATLQGCCPNAGTCAALQVESASPCVASTCGFSDFTCNVQTSYVATTPAVETLPCCKDTLQCEPTEDAVRCNYLRCNTPEDQVLSPAPSQFFTCSRITVTDCSETAFIDTNVAVTTPMLADNCTWACSTPQSNVVNLRAKLTNPAAGLNFRSPLYHYFIEVHVMNPVPALNGTVQAITLVGLSPFLPPSRTVSPALFALISATETGAYYKQRFAIAVGQTMPIYPNEELTLGIAIRFRTNATALTAINVVVSVTPFEICTPTLLPGQVTGTGGEPCVNPTDIGNQLPRPPVFSPTLTLRFSSGNCSPLCSSVGATTAVPSPASSPTPAVSTTATTTTTTTLATATPAPTVASTVSGLVFRDTSGDGFTNVPPEVPVSNVRFYLESSTNASDVRTTTSNSEGVYTFTSIPVAPYIVRVLNDTIPFGFRPTIIPGTLARRNRFQQSLQTPLLVGAQSGIDLGLAPVPPCTRRPPPSGSTGGLLVEFDASATSCYQCATLLKLRSKCSPNKCANLNRQFVTVEADVSNLGASPLGHDSLTLRLNSIGVGPLEDDNRPYVCAEAFSVTRLNAYELNSVASSGVASMASISFGWNTLAVGAKVVRVQAQFVYCSADPVSHFNITAEIRDSSCAADIVAWNRCDQTIDIRQCQATLARSVPACSGCPPTPPPITLPIGRTTLPPSTLALTAATYCLDALCVNTQTFANFGCPSDTTDLMAQCSAAVNRGGLMHQFTISNPFGADPSEEGMVVVSFQRNATDNEQLVCGERFGDHLPIKVLVEAPGLPGVQLLNTEESARDQTASFAYALPSLMPNTQIRITLVSYECSAHALASSATARIASTRCNDDLPQCTATAAPSFANFADSCQRYSLTGCEEAVVGVEAPGFGAAPPLDASRSGVASATPYFIVAVIFCLIVGCTCAAYAAFSRRRIRQSRVETADETPILPVPTIPAPATVTHRMPMRRGFE